MKEPTNITPQFHELKTLPEFWILVAEGVKTFEIRKNDRNFGIGDELILQEWNGTTFTGLSSTRFVSYMTDFGQVPGMVVMAIREDPVCPACGCIDVSKRHGIAAGGLETDFLSCDNCSNQWNHQ